VTEPLRDRPDATPIELIEMAVDAILNVSDELDAEDSCLAAAWLREVARGLELPWTRELCTRYILLQSERTSAALDMYRSLDALQHGDVDLGELE
jgi:hypothetical protein